MKQLAKIGIYMNFTYDEPSAVGADPALMYEAVRAIGVEHTILSSAGEPLFPNSVEYMRLMRAFGLNDEEIHRVSAVNPAAIVSAN